MSEEERRPLVAVNSTEWLNLIARRSIRMLKRRVISVGREQTAKEMSRVFALAPDTKLGSSVDLFILELETDWEKTVLKHPRAQSDVVILDLAAVRNHHPITAQDSDYYEVSASKAMLELQPPVFEESWRAWVWDETLSSSISAAATLQTALDVPSVLGSKRADRYSWSDVAALVLRPHSPIRTKPAHIESLLRGIRDLADGVAAVRDAQSFYVACSLEWIDLRLNKDPLRKKGDRERVQAYLQESRGLPLLPATEQTRLELIELGVRFPRAYSSEITPDSLASLIQLISDARSKRLKISTLVQALERCGLHSPSATLLTFVLATYLGPELTSQLVVALSKESPADLDWKN
jgi:hypothetical protein